MVTQRSLSHQKGPDDSWGVGSIIASFLSALIGAHRISQVGYDKVSWLIPLLEHTLIPFEFFTRDTRAPSFLLKICVHVTFHEKVFVYEPHLFQKHQKIIKNRYLAHNQQQNQKDGSIHWGDSKEQQSFAASMNINWQKQKEFIHYSTLNTDQWTMLHNQKVTILLLSKKFSPGYNNLIPTLIPILHQPNQGQFHVGEEYIILVRIYTKRWTFFKVRSVSLPLHESLLPCYLVLSSSLQCLPITATTLICFQTNYHICIQQTGWSSIQGLLLV